MRVTAVGSNMTQINSAERKKINVGYKVYPNADEIAKNTNCDTFENSEFTEKVKSQIKDRIANLKVPSLFDIKGKPCTSGRSDLQSAFRTVVGRDGSVFNMSYTSNRVTGEDYGSGYMDALAKEAAGEDDPDYFQYFVNMKADVVAAFGTAATYKQDKAAIEKAIFSAIDEMKENIANGKKNPAENLKTTVNMGGVEWGIKDILETSALIRSSFDGIDRTITMDYIEYAKMGLSVGNVQNYADKNLNKEQANAVKDILKVHIDYYTKRSDECPLKSKEKFESFGKSITPVNSFRAQYYKYGGWVSATNEELRSSLIDVFSSVGKNRSLNSALSAYKQLMPPALKASGVSEKSHAEVLGNHTRTLSAYYYGLDKAY